MKNLKHPNIPIIYDMEEDDNYTYIIEQYIEGESLKCLCNKRLLSETEIYHLIIHIGHIFQYLHSVPGAIAYCDLKPENIIVRGTEPFLIDFGSARSLSGQDCEAGSEAEQPGFGTRSFCAPEQLFGAGNRATDIYAIGRLLNYMLEHGKCTVAGGKKLRKTAGECMAALPWNRIRSVDVLLRRFEKQFEAVKKYSERPLRLAFAGAAANSGATRLALETALFMQKRRDVAYVENNGSEMWYTLAGAAGGYRGLTMVNRKYYAAGRVPEGSLVIDYGALCDGMPEDFYRADCTYIVLHSDEWEREEALAAEKNSRACRNRVFLLNLCDRPGAGYAGILSGCRWLAVPYMKDKPSSKEKKRYNDLFGELLMLAETASV